MKKTCAKYQKIVFRYLVLFAVAATIQSCLKNDTVTPVSIGVNNSAELLSYLESKGDYINSSLCPSLITPTDLYSMQNDVILLDIRDSTKFSDGHIKGAVNLRQFDIIPFLKKNKIKIDTNIVIVSTNGQSASFCTAGLRILGYQKVYALKYGMASWNSYFSDEWLKAIKTRIEYYADFWAPPKPPFKSLPSVVYSNSNLSLENKLLDRVTNILSENFTDDVAINYNTTYYYLSDGNVITSWNSYFKICYGNDSLYFNQSVIGYKTPGHITGVYYYQSGPVYELRSDQKLQSLPINNSILIYSKDGHLSAELTMYLKILGYDIRSLLFGGSYLFYYVYGPQKAFSSGSINNFPYEK